VSPELRAERVHVRHPGSERSALRDLSHALREGEILTLVGPNGSGKSTLLASLGRELAPRSGAIRLGDTRVGSLPARRFACCVARLPQDPETPEGLTVEELVAFGRNPRRGFLASLGAHDRDVIADSLVAVALNEHRKRRLETLSGGERRRAWLAMVLAQEPEILLLDEPTAALDLRHQWELLDLLRELNAARQVSIVASMHDLEQAVVLGQRMAVLHRGRLYALGKPADVLDEEMLLDVFGVEARVTPDDLREGGLCVQVLGSGDPLRSL